MPFCIAIYDLSSNTILFHITIRQTAQFSEKKNKLLNLKCLFSSTNLPETVLVLIRIQKDITINVHKSSCEVPTVLVRF